LIYPDVRSTRIAVPSVMMKIDGTKISQLIPQWTHREATWPVCATSWREMLSSQRPAVIIATAETGCRINLLN